MSMRTVRLVSLTILNVTAIALFLVLRLVDRHSLFGSMVTTGAITMGLLFAGFLAEKTIIDHEILKGQGSTDHE